MTRSHGCWKMAFAGIVTKTLNCCSFRIFITSTAFINTLNRVNWSSYYYNEWYVFFFKLMFCLTVRNKIPNHHKTYDQIRFECTVIYYCRKILICKGVSINFIKKIKHRNIYRVIEFFIEHYPAFLIEDVSVLICVISCIK